MIWLIAILLLAAFAGIGFLRGSIQMGISFLGLLLGVALAMPLAPMMLPIYTASGVTNLILLAVLPPITGFIVVGLVFMIVGIVVHLKVSKYFKYKTEEASQLMFKRLNQRIGAAFGLLVGVAYTIILGVGIYSTGYLTHQVATDADPGWLKLITDTRASMDGNGLGAMAASLDPMPEKFYEVSDLIGLAHKNPLLENRFRNYPPFLKLGDRADIQEIAGDSEFHGLLVQQASLADIMKHPLGQKVMSNAELRDILFYDTDLEDLTTYLNQGESPKYVEERILGRWQLNGNAMINHTKRTTAGIKGSDLRLLTELVQKSLDGANLVVYTDNSLMIDAPEAPEEEEEEEEPDNNGVRDEFADRYGGLNGGQPPLDPRYGLGPGQRPGGQRAQARPAAPEFKLFELNIGGGGNWERTAPGRYILELDALAEGMARANISKNRLLINAGSLKLVFSRVY